MYFIGFIGASNQGTSVSLNSNGNLLAVGGPNDNNFTGAVWIFEKKIVPQFRLICDSPAYTRFNPLR